MKMNIYDAQGKKKGTSEAPAVFHSVVREDIVSKYLEASRYWQPHSLDPRAGRRASASGTIKHRRHAWKGGYGRGAARTPRKIMWRRGTQFNWVGAEVANTRGGRRVNGPSGMRAFRKINQKEMRMAMSSAIAATAIKDYVKKRYESIDNVHVELPIAVHVTDGLKMKGFVGMLKEVFGELFEKAIKQHKVRGGVGKLRGRKYKSSAGVLLVTGSDEDIRASGVDVRPLDTLAISDLYPLGRLTIYTEKALEELKKWK